MKNIINLMEKDTLQGLHRLAYVWFELEGEVENMKKAITLNKENLIDFLLEDFEWSELPEKHFLALYEESKNEYVHIWANDEYVNLTNLLNAYIESEK